MLVQEAQQQSVNSLLDQIIEEGRLVRDPSQLEQRERAKELVGEFAEQALAGHLTPALSHDTVAMIQKRIEQIDQLLSQQIDEIIHAPEFQQLEAAWRGLHYLVQNTETSTSLKLRVLNVSREELQKDLDRAVEFDQSQLFKKVYEEEFGQFGGSPYGLLVGDFEFGRHPQDIGFLEKMSNVAAAAHAPFVAAAGPELFDMDSFTELGNPRDLAKLFESTELIKWKSFRESENSRYVALTLPHILLRYPYGPDTDPVREFDYEEDVDGRDHSKYLWGNASYALAERITAAFALYNWCGAVRGVEGGGKVEGLPAHTFKTDDGDVALKCPTEIAISDRREKELNDLGFISLLHCKNTDYAAFFGGHTTNLPKKYNLDDANANAQLSAMLPYMLVTSRFAHYIKVMMRNKIGSFASAQEIQDYLNTWINSYTMGRDDAGFQLKAEKPLRQASVEVKEIPGKPGYYKAVVRLRPHFQLEGLTTSIRLVADLPPPAA
ncbi:MAG: EvpB family type VI secretion protein [Thiotrichaceae bacterium IS1]|nr:MAG: EvpB family type VI secretion protein [Thiotrichaceae bacterium IS1]